MMPYRFRAVCSTTGIPNVNKPLFTYHVLTLLFLAGFALYDHRHHRIRNAALLAFLPWCLFSTILMYCVFPCLSPVYLGIRCILGFLSGFVLLLAVSLATGGGIGGGDIKLVALLGIPFGVSCLMAALVISCLYALIHMGIRKAYKKKPEENLPFAPYLFFGCATAMLLQLVP